MTPMKSALCPSTQQEVAIRKARKLVSQIVPGLVEAIANGDFPEHRFQEMIEREKNLRVRSRVTELLKSIISGIVDTAPVHVNYATPDAIKQAIVANGFNSVRIFGLKQEEIPVVGNGEVDLNVGMVSLSHYYDNTGKVLSEIKLRGYKFVDPLTALNFALKFPDVQRKVALTTLFRSDMGTNILILSGDASKRSLEISRNEGHVGVFELKYLVTDI
jgi:hypothetical protein